MQTASMDILDLAHSIGESLRKRGWTLATAESCTGGRIAHAITSIAGSSDYFQGGIVSYSNDAKVELLGVSRSTLERVGAVSRECAAEMARGARQALHANIGVSSTGIAGPGGATARKPVGLVYIGIATPDGDEVQELHLDGDRLAVIDGATLAALRMALDYLESA
jgi:PncC family amidohydrolase